MTAWGSTDGSLLDALETITLKTALAEESAEGAGTWQYTDSTKDIFDTETGQTRVKRRIVTPVRMANPAPNQ